MPASVVVRLSTPPAVHHFQYDKSIDTCRQQCYTCQKVTTHTGVVGNGMHLHLHEYIQSHNAAAVQGRQRCLSMQTAQLVKQQLLCCGCTAAGLQHYEQQVKMQHMADTHECAESALKQGSLRTSSAVHLWRVASWTLQIAAAVPLGWHAVQATLPPKT